ncbi:MAG: hypothetical protein HYT80_00320 [Euryarchaeota archaeon]|nr:hypothetical protein [Euryarchaeota archaeon]
MPADPVPVDSRVAHEVLEGVAERLPPGWKIMPIGGLGMMDVVPSPGQLTRDVDLVPLVLVDKEFRVPPARDVLALANALSNVVGMRKDETRVEAIVAVESGPVKVELIRGRNVQSGGYFVTRRVLEVAAGLSNPEGVVLRPPPEAMAFLKAWAAVDQDKLVEAQKDPNDFHRARAAAFRQDVSRVLVVLLGLGRRGHTAALKVMLDSCPENRAKRIRDVLREAGWDLP